MAHRKPKISKPTKPSKAKLPTKARTTDAPVRKINAAGYAGGGFQPSRHHKDWIWRGRAQARDEDRLVGTADRNRLRLRARDLYRNLPVVHAIVERIANLVGAQVPQARTSDPAFNAAAESYWANWCKVADARQRVPFWQIQRLLIIHRIIDGEAFLQLTSGGQLMPVEPERIATPDDYRDDDRVIDGIRLKNAVTAGYYVCDRNSYGGVDTTSYTFVPASDMIHAVSPSRFDQLRGISELAPVLIMLQEWDELSQSVLRQAKNQSTLAWSVGTEDGDGPSSLGPRDVTPDDATGQRIEAVADGQVLYGDVKMLSAAAPNATFDSFSKWLANLACSCLGLSPEIVLLDSQGKTSGSNFQSYNTIQNYTRWLQDICQRVYVWRTAKAVKAGELQAAPLDANGVSEWWKTEWTSPSAEWVYGEQPLRDEQQFLLGATSLTAIAKRRGQEFEDVLRQKAADIALAVSVAQEINKANGTNLTWRDLITAGSFSGALNTAQTANDTANTGKGQNGNQPE